MLFDSFSPQQLRDAIEIELQHDENPKTAAITAMKRLKEDPEYYVKKYGVLAMTKARVTKYMFKKPDGKGGWIYTYTDDFRNGKKKAGNQEIKIRMRFDSNDLLFNFNLVGYSERVGSLKTSEKSLSKSREIENAISSFDREYTSVIDNSGNIILSKAGDYDEIQFDENEIKKIRNAEILTHTHPEDKSFSVEDIFLGLSLGIKELRVKTPKNIYFFKISYKRESKNKDELSNKNRYFMNILINLNENITEILRKKVKDGKSNQKKAEIEHRELLWNAVSKSQLLVEDFNIEYGKIKK